MNRETISKTFEEQVETVLDWFKKSPKITQKMFKNTSKEDLIKYHHTLGRNIRNKFKLWEIPWEEEIINGVDVSPNHPDQLSMRIIEAVWDEVQKWDIQIEGYKKWKDSI